ATTAIDPAVLEAMRPFLEKYFANPSSGYRFAAQVREAIEQAREQVAALLGCEPGEIVFTSCGTASNNAAFHSALETRPDCKHVVTTAVEHSAVRKPAQELERRGYEVTVIGVDKSGRLSLRALADAIRPDTALVSVMWANNETGVIFPIEEIAEIARDKGVPLHTDAVQVAGKIPINLREIQLQFLSISGHKLHAPKGAGAPRLPNTSSIMFDDIESDAALMMLDQENICCSAGSACRTGSLQPSHVLNAMGLVNEQARGSLRFSFGRFNDEADIDRALEIVPRVIGKLQALSPAAAR